MVSLNIDRPKRASFVKVRFLIVLMGTLCPVVCYISRQNLSLAIVAMTKSSSTAESNNRTQQTKDGIGSQNPNITYGPKYDWEPSDTSLIFEAFFWTYVIFQIPGARFAEVIGAKWILAAATLGSSFLSIISPWAASFHVYAFVVVRALMGIFQTALYPACYVLYTQWLPPTERSRALPILGAGAYIGSIITSMATGFFSEQASLGWEYAFYMPSVICAIWSIIWIFIGSSAPREHKFISVEEIEYIESRMEVKKSSLNVKKSPSWSKILTSQHIWAMVAAFFASNWSFTITLLLLPSYLNNILRIPPFKNALINSVIFILFIISSPIVGAVSTLMIETRAFGLTRLQIRKLFQSIGLFSQALCFISLPLLGCDTRTVLGVLFIQIVLYSFVNGGEVQLPSELSLDFAGTIYAIGNCVGSSTGFIVPRVYSLVVTSVDNEIEWNMYFYLAASITSIGGLIFLIFGKNDLQDFSKDNCKSQAEIYKLSNGSQFYIETQISEKKTKEKQLSI